MKINPCLFQIPVVLLIIITSCTKVENEIIDPEKEVFNFIVTDAQREYINASRGVQYEVTDPDPELYFAGEKYTVDRFEIRGDGTLNFTRKGFGVNMGRKITLLNPEEQVQRKFEEFKLLAMVFDFTYIENSIGTGLFREVGMWPVYSFFTEVRLNGHTQGLYHFIEDPFEYFMEQKNASFVIRRGYDHIAKAYSVNPAGTADPQKYLDRFKRIYYLISAYSGVQAFDSLSAYIDLNQYFTKLSIDMLLKNGDYTDEVIFYTKSQNNREVFGVFPWDLDDIFSDKPHEIGNPWATGSTFGQRTYNSIEDIVADVGFKLLYSVEEDLDYKIARDSFLYQQYLTVLRKVVEKISSPVIDRVFDLTFEHIGPFYSNDSVIAQSRFDVDETDYGIFLSNLAAKRQMLKDRREMILRELDTQQKR